MKASTTLAELRKIIVKTGAVAIWLLVWHIVSLLIDNFMLFPQPLTVISRLFEMVKDSTFRLSCLTTIGRISAGCVAGVAAGTVLGILSASSKILREVLNPALTLIKTTPVASFIILLLVLATRDGSVIFVSALLAVPVMWSNVAQAIMVADKQKLEMAEMFRFSKGKKIRYIYVPEVMPSFFSGITTAIGFSWKAGISAEVLAIPENAIGTGLYHAKISLEYTDVYAWTLAVIILSLIIEKVLVFLLDKFVFGRALNEH